MNGNIFINVNIEVLPLHQEKLFIAAEEGVEKYSR